MPLLRTGDAGMTLSRLANAALTRMGPRVGITKTSGDATIQPTSDPSLCQKLRALVCGHGAQLPEAKKKAFFDKHPATREFRLSTGETAKLPMHINDMDMTQVIGFVNAADIADSLAANNVQAITIPTPWGRKAIAAFTTIHYEDSSIGPYEEVIVGVLAKGTSPRTQGVGFYMPQLYVTTDKSLKLGREAWGFNKDMADVRYVEENGQIHVKVIKDGRMLLDFAWHERGGLCANFLLPPKQTAITPTEHGQHRVNFASLRPNLTTTLFRPRRGDVLTVSPDSAWGEAFASFAPAVVMHATNGIGVILPPGE